jgi:hypothetical protein
MMGLPVAKPDLSAAEGAGSSWPWAESPAAATRFGTIDGGFACNPGGLPLGAASLRPATGVDGWAAMHQAIRNALDTRIAQGISAARILSNHSYMAPAPLRQAGAYWYNVAKCSTLDPG